MNAVTTAADIATTPRLTVGARAGSLRDVLQKRIDEGTVRAGSVIERIHADVPTDQIAKATALTFRPTLGGIGVQIAENVYSPSDYALGQLAGRAGVPTTYLRELVGAPVDGDGMPWQRDLAAEILRRHFAHAEGRVLARSVRGQLRGVLSDKYRRLDCRPLVDALVTECQRVGAIPFDGTATDTRVALKVLFPEVLEPVPGEFMVVGGEWSNSDYGNGVHGFRAFFLRAVCLNGATAENVLRQVHLGGRLSDDVEFSARTYRLDTETSISALRDTVRGVLGPAGRDRVLDQIRESSGKEYGSKQLAHAVRNLPKADAKAVVDAFNSSDVINLPAGNTAWRASNALSWIAKNTTDDEKRLDLERLAGSVVSGKAAA